MVFKTHAVKQADLKETWYVVDATDQTLGRLATQIATILRGKHRPDYSPHLDLGDYVIVVNAEKVRLAGKKTEQKMYYRHSQYPGGLKTTSFQKMLADHPTRIIERAVHGMLPHNRLGEDLRKKLKVYTGPEHPHQAQQPKPLSFDVAQAPSK